MAKLLTHRNLFLERVAIQVGRHSIINLRKVLGVKKLYSSKAFGFFAKEELGIRVTLKAEYGGWDQVYK